MQKSAVLNRAFFNAQKEAPSCRKSFYRTISTVRNRRNLFIYFKIPRLLITDQKFKHVSTDAKLLYGMLLDRMGLSAKNGWYDELGRVYIYYTVDEKWVCPSVS